MSPSGAGPILTLEPLIEAVRDGVEAAGWELSGLQKTTSHQFEGRWAGDSTRSAYLFFHAPSGPDWASVDIFLDETSRGLSGNLALVADLVPLDGLKDVHATLTSLTEIAVRHLPEGYRTPITLRLRLDDADRRPGEATSEVRFKLRIPRTAMEAGARAVAALASTTVRSFSSVIASGALAPLLEED